MDTLVIPIDAESPKRRKLTSEEISAFIASELHTFSGLPIQATRRVIPRNDWEEHLASMEALHETLDAQQRGE